MKVRLITDGGSRGNPGKSASAAIILDDGGSVVIARQGKCIGTGTNNIAEYQALILGLELCKEIGATEIKHHSDSSLVVNQMTGKWRVKDKALIRLNWKALELENGFISVKHVWLPNKNNYVEQADALVNQCLDASSDFKQIYIKLKETEDAKT